jgi:hypothetical protein
MKGSGIAPTPCSGRPVFARRVVRLGVTATDARELLLRLTAERYDAHDVGLGENLTFMADLEADIVECRDAVVLLSVLEIAVLRAQIEEPLLG